MNRIDALVEIETATVRVAQQAHHTYERNREIYAKMLTDAEHANVRLDAMMDKTSEALRGAASEISSAWQQTESLIADGVLDLTTAVTRFNGDVGALRGAMLGVEDAWTQLDPTGRQKELQSLILAAKSGKATLDEVVAGFTAGGGQLSQRVAQIVADMQSGAASAEQSLAKIEQLQQIADFETGNIGGSSNSAFTNLLQLLEGIVRQGGIGGLEDRVADAVKHRLGPLLDDRRSTDTDDVLIDQLQRLGDLGGFG